MPVLLNYSNCPKYPTGVALCFGQYFKYLKRAFVVSVLENILSDLFDLLISDRILSI